MRNITKHIYKIANQFTLLSVLILIITLSLVVQATLTELTSQRLSPQSLQLTVDSTLPADIQAQEQATINFGFDRDTNTEYTAYGHSQITVQLAQETEITQIKIFNAAPYAISVQAWVSGSWQAINGLQALDLSSLTDQWHSYAVTSAVSTDRLQISLSASTGGSAAGLKELEIWGKAERVTINTGANLLAAVESEEPPMQARIYVASQEEGIIGNVVGLADRAEDNTFNINIDQDRGSIKRAWLTYESHGAGHWVSVIRRINQQAAIGGSYRFASTAWAGQVEQINPAWLLAGENNIEFSVPAGNSYRIRKLKLLVELDDGSNLVDEITAAPESINSTARFAHDGDSLSGWQSYASTVSDAKNRHLQLTFDKATQLDAIALQLDNSLAGKIELETLSNGEWGNAGVGAILGKNLIEGWNRLEIQSDKPVDGVKLLFFNGVGSAGEILEIAPIGSGTGQQQSPPRIEVGYPDAGQYYGNSAYIRGFIQPVDNGSGQVKTFIAGREISREDGAVEALVNKKEFTVEGNQYSVTVDALYPDGAQVSRKIYLSDAYNADAANAVLKTYAYTGDDSVGDEAVNVNSGDNYRIEHDEGILQLSKEALDEGERPSAISIASLKHEDLPPLNLGMTNVTKGPRNGYRFSPHGKKFRKNIDVYIAYDKTKIPAGLSEEDIKTWYFDEEVGRWVALEKVSIDTKAKVVKSHTDHFTDMINATITVPDSPQAASFNPTQIKDIKAADPGAGINLIEPPQANNQGSANLNYPIEIPAGRNGMQPQLAISYNSGGGNGWLGLGWDLSVPSISIDTRWGVPRYSTTKETETYSLNGQMLSPVAHRRALVDRTANTSTHNGETVKVFHLRVEGSFQKIIRHGSSPSTYWWEVIDKNGTRNLYGGDGVNQHSGSILARTADEHVGVINTGAFKWMLRKTIDTNGNTVTYNYEKNCDTGTGTGACSATIKGKQLYLKEVLYTGHGDSEGKYLVEFVRDSARSGYIRNRSNSSYNPAIDRRPDVSINATGGFKYVTSERLVRVNVKYDSQLIRRYDLNYAVRAFNKSLLENIVQLDMDGNEFNRHEFAYHDSITQANGQLAMFSDETDMPAHNDYFALLGFPQTLIGGSLGVNGGFNGFFGIGPPWFGEDIHAAVTVKASASISQSNINLIDVDGDGLADKVFERLGQVSYRKNISDINSGVLSFKGGDPQEISGINRLSFTESLSWGPGVKAQAFVATAYAAQTNTATTDSAYFADVNGDGLIDQIDNRTVQFGYLNSANLPQFSSNSGATIAPIGAGNINAEVLLSNMAGERTKMEEDNPLMDALRRWVVPYDGRINISGDVQLHNFKTDTSLSEADVKKRLKYETADGVRVSIQHDNDEIWAVDINPDDADKPNDYEAKSPAITYLDDVPALTQERNVTKGQVLYFRVHSKYDGNYDRVSWSPKITYINASGEALIQLDANQRNAYFYDAESDFVLAGRPGRIVVDNYGSLKIQGELRKSGMTSDDVTLKIQLFKPAKDENDEPILTIIESEGFEETLNWNDEGVITLDHTMEVEKGQSISIKVFSDSPIDLSKLEWTGESKSPRLFYESAYEPEMHVKQPVIDSEQSANSELPDSADDVVPADPDDMPVDGGVIPRRDLPAEEVEKLNFLANYDADIYPGTTEGNGPQQAYEVTESGVLLLTPWVALKTYPDYSCDDWYDWDYWTNALECPNIVKAPDGKIIFTVKRNGQLLAKQELEVLNKQIVASKHGYDALKAINVTENDKLFFEFSVRNPRLQAELNSTRVFTNYGSNEGWQVPLTDNTGFKASIRAGFPNNSDEEVTSRPVIFIARRGAEIIEQKKIMVNDSYTNYLHDFNFDVEKDEKYYFDFFTIDQSISINNKNVWAKYTGIAPLSITKTGDIAVHPKLNFTSPANGVVTLSVSRNGQAWQTQNYTVVDSLISDGQAPVNLSVDDGDSVRFFYKTSDHVLSSSLADKGAVSIDYVTQTIWKVPNNWDESDGNVALAIQPQLIFANSSTPSTLNGEVGFRVWRNNEVIVSTTLTVSGGQAQASNALPLNITVKRGETLGFEYLTASSELVANVTNNDVVLSDANHNATITAAFNLTDIIYGSQAFEILMPSLAEHHHLKSSVRHFSIDDQLYGNPYRGWAYIAYNSDHEDVLSATDPIKTSLLTPVTEENKQAVKDPDTEHAYYLALPSAKPQRWESMDNNWWITGREITSSRHGLDQIDLPSAENFNNVSTGIIQRIPRRSTASTFSAGGGAYFTVNFSNGSSSGDLDLMDLNGDRYPDMIGGGSVQYTNARGEMAETLSVLSATNVTRTDGKSYSIGPAPQDSSPGATGKGFKTGIRKPAAPDKDASTPFSAGVDSGNSIAENQLMDLNGDGLPDQVIRTGSGVSVKFNLGYDFAPAEPWGASEINHSSTVGLSFGPISYTTNDGQQQLMDLNGDGLVDRVVAGSGGQLHVNFNTGAGFGPSKVATGFISTAEFVPGGLDLPGPHVTLYDGASLSGSYGSGFTYAFTVQPIVPLFDLVWGVGASVGATVTQPTIGLRDMNGDGQVDGLRSVSDSDADVVVNRTGYTNMLKSVSRPLGASFNIEYKRTGNTYDLPSSRWVMSKVAVFDGAGSDTPSTDLTSGSDYKAFSYDYLGGKQDRVEREFLGFGQVIQKELNTAGKNVAVNAANDAIFTTAILNDLSASPVYRQSTQTYLNNSFYTKGLLTESSTKGRVNPDGSGELGLYRKTENNYVLKHITTGNELDNLSLEAQQLQLKAYRDSGDSLFPMQVQTEQFFYEGASSEEGTHKSIFTEQQYDDVGNIIVFHDAGDTDSTNDDVWARIKYTYSDTNESGCAADSLYIVGKPSEIVVRNNATDSGSWLRKRVADFNSCADGTGNLKEVRQHLATGGSAVTVMDEYDDYGNLTQVTGPANNANDSLAMAFTYDTQTHTYPVTISNDSYGIESSAAYDYKFGKPLCTIDVNGNPMAYRYDNYGRTAKIVGPYELGGSDCSTANGDAFTIQFTYSPYVNLAESRSLSVAKTEHYNRDADNNPLETTINTWLFTDGMKRVLQTKKTAAVDEGGNVASGRIVSGRVSFDALGRSIKQYYPEFETGNTAANFNTSVDGTQASVMTYDALDRNLTTILPDNTPTSIGYDFGSNFSGSELINYFRTTVTDANGKQKTTYRDARELIHAVIEEGGILTRYQYDPLKQITQVKDAANNLTQVSYDELGRRTAINNPDTGNTDYKYDLASNLIEKITANLAGETDEAGEETKAAEPIVYRYDHTRLIAIEYPNDTANNVSYEYGNENDTEFNQAGRIISASHQGGSDNREYGKLGEVKKETRVISVASNGGSPVPSYTTEYDFDTFGRLMNLTLPDGEIIKHDYDIGGNLNHISGRMDGSDYVYLENLSYDKFEQRRSMELGNGIKTRYHYNPEHRRLCKLETGLSVNNGSDNQCQTLPRVSTNEDEQTALTSALNGITASNAGQFQNLHYAYDRVGNILGTSNAIQTPKRNEMGGPTVKTFQYDDLYRLTKANGSYLNAQGNEHRYTLDMEYSNIHNITSKDQFHEVISKNGGSRTQTATTYDWGYQYSGIQPHAPTHIGNRSFKYDANGNQTGWTNDNNGQKRNITWDDENRIQKIGDPSNTLSFAYDDSGQRVLKRGQHGQTEYVNQFFTVRNNALHSKHIFAGSSRIASKVEPGKPVGKFGSTSTTATESTTTETTLLESIQQSASEVITEVKAFFGINDHPGQGLEHRNERANEVARNTEKNKHLNGGTPGGEHGSSNSNAGGNGNNSGNNGNDDNGNQSNNANDNANSGNGNSRAPYDYGGTFLYYYHPDHLGSTGYVTDENADLYEHIEYFPFGETWLQEAANTYQRVPYRYTSKELDTETGLYYYGARYYDPRTSVWQSADPILGKYLPTGDKEQDAKLPGMGGIFNSRNLGMFGYVGQNPIMLLDPNGNEITVSKTVTTTPSGVVKTHYDITFTAVMLDRSSKNFSDTDMQALTSRMESQIEASFKGSDGNVSWSTTAKIKAKSGLGGLWHKILSFFGLTSKHTVNIRDSSDPILSGGLGIVNDFGGDTANINADITNITPGTSTGNPNTSYERTSAHEFGHLGGLKHPSGNLMDQTWKSNSLLLDKNQIESMHNDYNADKLNEGLW